MTTLSPARENHLTVNDLLADGPHDHRTAEALAAGLIAFDRDGTRSGGIDQLSAVARGAVYRQVGIAAEGLLDFDLTDAVVAGWLKYKALVDAARRTLGSSAREVVPLVSHRITSTYSPVIEVYIDEVRAGSVEFQLDLIFEIIGCSVAVASGDLVAVEGGDVKVTGNLGVRGKTLLTKSKQFDSHLVVDLRRPVPLTNSAS